MHGFLIAAFCIKAFNSALACFPDKTVLPAALRSLSDGLEVDFFLHYTEYFVLGWYLRSFGIQEKRKRVVVYCLALASVVGMISSVILTGEYVRVYINVDIVFLFPSIALFDLVSSAKLDLSERSARNIRSLSKLTLGVYLVHPICISIFGAFVAYSAHPALYIAGFSVGVTLLSFAMSFVISRIPLLKKLIRA